MRLGIDYGGTNIKTGIFSEEGNQVVFLQNKLTEFTSDGNLLDNLILHIKSISKEYPLTSGGLAIKGLINSSGVIEDDIGAGALLAGINLRDAFGSELKIPFRVENDARAYAWGEYRFGAGRGSKAMVCLTLGTGVGCSVIAEDKPYYGADVLGGLLGGHISIDRNGPDCPCGNKGCLELYCSATAFAKHIADVHPEIRASEDILEEFFNKINNLKSSPAKPGEENKYFDTLRSFQEDLSIGIVNVIHAYGPDTVVLGGGVMNSAFLILPHLTELVHKRAWTFPRKKVKIKPSELGNKAAALGVAFL